jgi:TM2 domain-containing membrane protein YozV
MTEKEIEKAVEQGVINALIGPPRNKWITLLLWALFGPLGIYKFYEGKNGTGILYFLTFGLCGIGWFFDFFIIIFKPTHYYPI